MSVAIASLAARTFSTAMNCAPGFPASRIVVEGAGDHDVRTYGLRPCHFARNGVGARLAFSSGFFLFSKASFTRALKVSVDTI
jgi:hypothetical protein